MTEVYVLALKFYDMYDVDHTVPGVPAVVVTEINKMFGL